MSSGRDALVGEVADKDQDLLFASVKTVRVDGGRDCPDRIDVGNTLDRPNIIDQRFGHFCRLSVGHVLVHQADEEVALQRAVHPDVDVLDVVEDVGPQADGRADGNVEDADGQRGSHAAAEDLPMGNPSFRAQQRIQHRGHDPRQQAQHERDQQQEGGRKNHAGDDHDLHRQIAENARRHHRTGGEENAWRNSA